jgi:hypothetical protein
MFDTKELADFAIRNFQRGLEGLTDAEARTRFKKADGGAMNSISWTAGHIAWHWTRLATRAASADSSASEPFADLRGRVFRFRTGSDDPTPPPLDEVLGLLNEARAANAWLDRVDEPTMASLAWNSAEGNRRLDENVGTTLMRVVLHTWFHAGEVNAMRQMLGHAEIEFVGPMVSLLEWHPA